MDTTTITRFSYNENRSTRVKRRSCNSEICFAYLMSVFAVTLIVGGVYLSYTRWNKLWLILGVIGIVVNLFGSCFYYSGTNKLYKRNEEHIYENRSRRGRYRTRGLSSDQLMPSAPPLSQSRSVSQLSLNMIPQYFSSNESEAISMANQSNSTSISPLTSLSQIFSVNGQSYLILPLTGEPLTASNSFPLQNFMVKLTDDNKLQTSNPSETRDKTETKMIEFESQSCQTETPIDLKKDYHRRRDVQLQTMSRTQLDQIDSQVINSGPQTSRYHQVMQTTSSDESRASTSTDSSSQASGPTMEQFQTASGREVDTDTVVTLIDLNDDSNDGVSTEAIGRSSGDNSSQDLLDMNDQNESVMRVEESIDCQFDSFVSEDNGGEEQIEDLSVPPPSYEDVIDYRGALDDDEPIIVDYGTL